MNYPFADLELARRLERGEAKSNAAFVESRARVAPELGATWMERAGAYAMFDGPGSPLTQTFGLGVFAQPTNEDLAALEQFFEQRGAEVFHEVSPLAGMETYQLLSARGYKPIELSSVLYQPIARALEAQGDSRPSAALTTRIATKDEADLWAATLAEGWSESPELGDFLRDMGRVNASSEGIAPFLAELDGRPIAAGALWMFDGVAILAGASTIPSARNQGAQRVLLEARLRHAAGNGCDLAMMAALPGSTSQRNAERRGFRIAYTRVKWAR
jgi:GNAT superfamily N-acetyltransferase